MSTSVHPPYQFHRPSRAVYPRTYCAIPGCRRTSARFPEEWLCGDHWKRLERRHRAVLRRLWRLQRKIGHPAMNQWQQTLGCVAAREWRCWLWAKRRAA